MSPGAGPPDELRDLFDSYCDGRIDDEAFRRLEARLLANPSARREFVEFYRLHTELTFAVRARNAASAFFARARGGPLLSEQRGGPNWLAFPPASRTIRRVARAVAAGVAIAAVAYGAGRSGWRSTMASRTSGNVAWLVNAQDCVWSDGDANPGGDLGPGRMLRLRRGLAEFEFGRGARVLIQGPAELELLSGNEARLRSGAITAHVPAGARGFTVHTPGGKVIDLGTEFGLAVDGTGSSALRVFDGEVEAIPGDGGPGASAVKLFQNQAARLDGRAVELAVGPVAGRFIRSIVPRQPVIPRVTSFPFERPIEGTLLDAEKRGIGLTHRLPGTGADWPEADPNFHLDTLQGALQLSTTSSDVNTQFQLGSGEFPGLRLADLGCSGDEDFAIAATLPNIPGLDYVGQFGLYVGAGSDQVLRGGLIRHEAPDHYRLFLVNNHGGRDSDLEEVGLTNIGDDLRLILKRVAGAFSLVVENQTRHSSSTLAIAHPSYLDGHRDLYVGIFGASPKTQPRTLTFRHVEVTVWGVKDGPVPARAPDR